MSASLTEATNMLKTDQELIGKPEQEVINYFAANNILWRYGSINGVAQIGTCDHRIERRNLSVDNGIVTMITHG